MHAPLKAAELRNWAGEWLVQTYPESIIVNELSVADWGGASVDVAAITATHIVGVEIKGAGDSPARLELQGIKYPMVAREMWLLCDESVRARCHKRRPAGWGRLEVWDGRVRPYNKATKLGEPEDLPDGGRRWPMVRDDTEYWPDSARVIRAQSPYAMCGTLWADELRAIVGRRGIRSIRTRATVPELTRLIVDSLPAPEIHDEMILCLRERAWKKAVRDTRATSVS